MFSLITLSLHHFLLTLLYLLFPGCCPLVCVWVCVSRWPTCCRWRVTASQAHSPFTTPMMSPPPPPQRHPPPPGLPCPGRTLIPPPTPLLPHLLHVWRPLSTSWTAAPGCGRTMTSHLRFLHEPTAPFFVLVCVCVYFWWLCSCVELTFCLLIASNFFVCVLFLILQQ